MEPKYPDIYVPLLGHDGNAALIIGRTMEALRRGRVPQVELDTFAVEATSGNYDHVLQTVMGWVSVGEPPAPEPEYDPAACPDCGSKDYYPGTAGCRSCGGQRMPVRDDEEGE